MGTLEKEVNKMAKVRLPISTGNMYDLMREDTMCRDIRLISLPRCVERLSREMVHLRVQILDPFQQHHPHQVGCISLVSENHR